MWICVQYGSVHVDMCSVWISTCGYVYSMDQYMWICVQYGSVHVDMCTVWISTCGYVYSMDQYMWICVQYGMDQYMWIHTYVYSMDQYMWICVQYGSGQQVIHIYSVHKHMYILRLQMSFQFVYKCALCTNVLCVRLCLMCRPTHPTMAPNTLLVTLFTELGVIVSKSVTKQGKNTHK